MKEHIKRWLDTNSNIVHRYGILNTKLPSRKLNKYSGINAAQFVSNNPYNRQNPKSVTTMLQQLNWPTLEDRHKASDLILMYKVVNSLVAVPVNYLPPRSPRYADCIRFIAYHCRLNVYQHLFFPRNVIPWNRLPDSTELGWLQTHCPARTQDVMYSGTVQCIYMFVFT